MVRYATTEPQVKCLCGVRYAHRESICAPHQELKIICMGIIKMNIFICPSCELRAVLRDSDIKYYYQIVKGQIKYYIDLDCNMTGSL